MRINKFVLFFSVKGFKSSDICNGLNTSHRKLIVIDLCHSAAMLAASLALNSRLGEGCRAKTKLYPPQMVAE